MVAVTKISASLYTDAGPHTTHFNHRRKVVCVCVWSCVCFVVGVVWQQLADEKDSGIQRIWHQACSD